MGQGKITEDEQLKIAKVVFDGIPVETEAGDHGQRILVNKFLSVEPYPVERRTLTKTIIVDGWMACLDNGEDVVYLYEGTDFWEAMKEMASVLAIWVIDQIRDKVDPCMVPSKMEIY